MNRNKMAAAIGIAAMNIVVPTAFASVLEEVTVTAQKREQSLQDVGIAVTAFTGKQLDTLGFTNSSDIAVMTPSVHVGANVGGQSQQFTIRGVMRIPDQACH